MTNVFTGFRASTSGASAAEYALIVAILGGLVIAGALAFGGSIETVFSDNGDRLEQVALGGGA